MRALDLFFVTKNPYSVKTFLDLVKEYINKNTFLIKKIFFIKKTKKVMTILKSPHINKSAQEQFELDFLSLQLRVYAIKIFKCFVFFKKLSNSIFADISLKIKLLHNFKNQNIFEQISCIARRWLLVIIDFLKPSTIRGVREIRTFRSSALDFIGNKCLLTLFYFNGRFYV